MPSSMASSPPNARPEPIISISNPRRLYPVPHGGYPCHLPAISGMSNFDRSWALSRARDKYHGRRKFVVVAGNFRTDRIHVRKPRFLQTDLAYNSTRGRFWILGRQGQEDIIPHIRSWRHASQGGCAPKRQPFFAMLRGNGSYISGTCRNLPGRPPCSGTGFVSWPPLASPAPGALVFGYWHAVSPLGWLSGIGLGRIEEFRPLRRRERPNGL